MTDAHPSSPPQAEPNQLSTKPAATDPLTRFFGGSPLWVLAKLAMLSVVIGVLLAVLDLDAFEILRGLRELFFEFFDNIWDAVETVFRWFVLGAVIVFPLWLLSRLLKLGSRT